MTALFALVILTALFSGAAIGCAFGFAIASHGDSTAGIRPRTGNALVRFISKRPAEYNFFEGLAFAILMIAWLPIFFGLCALPYILADQAIIDDSFKVNVLYIAFGLALLLSRGLGARAWNTFTR